MSQAVRGGRAILNRLQEDLKTLDELAIEAAEHILRNPLRSKDCAEDIQGVLRNLQRVIADELEPLLKRREANGANGERELHERLARLEARMARMEERQAAAGDDPAPR